MKENITITELKKKVLEGKRKMILEQNGENYTNKEIMEQYQHIFSNIEELKKEYEFLVFHGYIEE